MLSTETESVLPDSYPTAYTLEWGSHMPCTRTPLEPASPQEAGPSSSPPQTHKMFVLRDTSDQDANHTICSLLDIDPAFLAAHTAGQRYRPRERPWRVGAGKRTFLATSYVYPQTLTITVPDPRHLPTSYGMVTKNQQTTDTGVQNGNESHPYSSEARTINSSVAMLCRASLWTSPRANVLLLDQSPSSTSLEDALLDALDDMSMETSSTTAMKSPLATIPETLGESLANTLSGLASDQWLDFVDTLCPGNRRGVKQGKFNKKLLWDMAQALEQNLAMSRVHNKQEHHQQQATGITGPEDWQALLSRLQRIVALLPLQNQGPAAAAAAPSSARFRSADASYTVNRMLPDDIGSLAMRRVPEAQVGSKTSESRHSSADIPVSASESRNSSAGVPAPTPASELRHAPAGVINARHRPSFSQTPAGQNALNRITYMGGILLPFSIIAGVLSMSDPFGPGDRLFWVFWVITLPITAFTLAVIYADDIRKSYIWSPMNHKSLQDAISRGEAIPAATAAALARATERINDKFSAPDSDSDSDIESETVLSAVRPVESPTSTGQTRARARVRVHTSSDPSGPLFYRLSEPSRPQQCRLSSPGPFVSPEGVANNHGPSPMVTPEENVEIQTPIMNASIRRRSHILGPLRRGWSTTARPHGGDPSTKPETGLSPNNIEAANPYGETVMIDVARPNVDPDIAEMFGPPNGIDVTAPGCPTILLAQRRRDTDPAAWRRQQLGWIGAIKKMTGYLKTQDA